MDLLVENTHFVLLFKSDQVRTYGENLENFFMIGYSGVFTCHSLVRLLLLQEQKADFRAVIETFHYLITVGVLQTLTRIGLATASSLRALLMTFQAKGIGFLSPSIYGVFIMI